MARKKAAAATTGIDTDGENTITERQRRVLDAALDVFAERGFAAASTAAIAERAGVAEGTLFKHYRTKKDLLLGAVAPVFVRFVLPVVMRDVKMILQTPYETPEQMLHAVFANRLAFGQQHLRAIRVALQELPFHDDVRALVVDNLAKEILPLATGAIERFQSRGQIRACSPQSVLRLVAGSMATYLITSRILFSDRYFDDESELNLMVDVLVQGLRPHGRPAPPT